MRKKIHDEGHAAGDEPDERDELRLLGDEAERIFLRVAFVDEPFADVPDDFDHHVHEHGQER